MFTDLAEFTNARQAKGIERVESTEVYQEYLDELETIREAIYEKLGSNTLLIELETAEDALKALEGDEIYLQGLRDGMKLAGLPDNQEPLIDLIKKESAPAATDTLKAIS